MGLTQGGMDSLLRKFPKVDESVMRADNTTPAFLFQLIGTNGDNYITDKELCIALAAVARFSPNEQPPCLQMVSGAHEQFTGRVGQKIDFRIFERVYARYINPSQSVSVGANNNNVGANNNN